MAPFTGTLTASTLSTTPIYDLPSPPSFSPTTPRITSDEDDDNDQIVWNVSEGSGSAQVEGVITSDEDFVVLAKSRSDLLTSVEDDPLEQQTPVSTTKPLEVQMSTPSSSSKAAAKKAKRSKRSKKAPASSVPDTMTTSQQRNKKGSAKSPKHADISQVVSAFEHLGLGERPIVDDLSEQVSVVSDDKTPTVYEEASTFISMFLSDPHAKTDKICRLTLLQSLIIELGLGTSSALPATLSAAKTFLKARAFLNIREYMAVRGQGSEAVQSVMYPSKSALIKSIKKKRNATSVKRVKELGLQVLLVECMH
jgi:hypothetical protein